MAWTRGILEIELRAGLLPQLMMMADEHAGSRKKTMFRTSKSTWPQVTSGKPKNKTAQEQNSTKTHIEGSHLECAMPKPTGRH